MTYIMSSGTLNPCIPYHTIPTQQYQFLMISNFKCFAYIYILKHPSNVVAHRPVGCCPVRLSPSWFVAQMTVQRIQAPPIETRWPCHLALTNSFLASSTEHVDVCQTFWWLTSLAKLLWAYERYELYSSSGCP